MPRAHSSRAIRIPRTVHKEVEPLVKWEFTDDMRTKFRVCFEILSDIECERMRERLLEAGMHERVLSNQRIIDELKNLEDDIDCILNICLTPRL